jgi:uncharacterized protein
MQIDILITIVGTSIIQSVFGVGVLLFGTPILMALDYNFVKSLSILLPISLMINLVQIAKDYKKLDVVFYKNILICTIPFVVICLLFVTKFKVNMNLVLGIFLLVIAIKDSFSPLNRFIKFLLKYEKIFLGAMGVIHGISNLGGSLLTAIVHSKRYDKNIARTTVAASYATFAAFQILTLLFSSNRININFLDNIEYIIIGIIVFFITEKTIYMEINNQMYTKFFAVFLFCSGVLLCLKTI